MLVRVNDYQSRKEFELNFKKENKLRNWFQNMLATEVKQTVWIIC